MGSALGLYFNGVNPNPGYASLGLYLYRNVVDLEKFGHSEVAKGLPCPDVLVRMSRRTATEAGDPSGDNWGPPIQLWTGIREFSLGDALAHGLDGSLGTIPLAGSMLSSIGVASFISTLLKEQGTKYSVVFGGHGDGPTIALAALPVSFAAAVPAGSGSPATPTPAGVDPTADALLPSELCTGLAVGGISAARKLEIIGFDACQNATLELAIEIRDHAEYLVASEVNIPFGGWTYHDWPATFFEAGTAASRAGAIVDSYAARYASGISAPATLAAVDLGALSAVASNLKRLSARVLSDPALLGQLLAARATMPTLPISQSKKVDAIELFERVAASASDAQLAALAKAVSTGLEGAIGGRFFANQQARTGFLTRGLSISFPTNIADVKPRDREIYFTNPQELKKFKHDTHWQNVIARVLHLAS